MEETEIAGRLSAVEQRSKSNSHRLDALERHTEAVNTLATSVAVMAEKVETILRRGVFNTRQAVEIGGRKGHLHRRSRCCWVYSCPARAGLNLRRKTK